MKFETRNLIVPQKDLGLFDVIFLRNVLIYFNDETKEIIIKNILSNLKVGGYLIISLTEHIHNLEKYNIKKVDNSIFQKYFCLSSLMILHHNLPQEPRHPRL